MSAVPVGVIVCPNQSNLDSNGITYLNPNTNIRLTTAAPIATGNSLTMLSVNSRYYADPSKLYRITLAYELITTAYTGTPNGQIGLAAFYGGTLLAGASSYVNAATTNQSPTSPTACLSAFFRPVAGQSLTISITNTCGATLNTGAIFDIVGMGVEQVSSDFTMVSSFT